MNRYDIALGKKPPKRRVSLRTKKTKNSSNAEMQGEQVIRSHVFGATGLQVGASGSLRLLRP